MPAPNRVLVGAWSPTSGGPAALGTVLRAYGRKLSPADLERLANAVGRKATLESLSEAARSGKFAARIVRVNVPDLPQQPLPAVAEWNGGAGGPEFRVLIDTRPGQVEVFDPVGRTRGWIGVQELEAGWTGRVLLAHPRSV
jgi:ABC-type bacteriocin/lantibiotic exporter with double-glycine peptidase domain